MAEERSHPQRELPLGSRTRGPGQPAAPTITRQVALAAERRAVVVRRLRWREALAPPAEAASPAAPGSAARAGSPAAHVSTTAVLRALVARTGRRIRRSLGLDTRTSDGV